MPTECSADLFGFARVAGRDVVASFDGGRMTSDAGALLLGATDRVVRLIDRFAGCLHVPDLRLAATRKSSWTCSPNDMAPIMADLCSTGIEPQAQPRSHTWRHDGSRSD